MDELVRDYEHHAREARVVVAEYFDAAKVLSPLLDEALAARVG